MKALALLLLLSSALLFPRSAFARDAWVEVRSPHFIVMSDSNAKQATHLADQFERMRAVLHTLFPDARVDAPAPILVIALKEQKGFKALEPSEYLAKGKLDLAGYFLHGPEKNYILLRLDASQEHPFATVYHEYTHFAFSGAQEWMPLWLNEGIAEFFQNTDIHDKEVDLGQPSSEDVLYLRQNRLIPLPVLFRVDHESPYYHDENKGSVFYAESWALVHYLEVTDRQTHQDRIGAYAQRLAQNQDPATAAAAAFGDLGRLQRDLEMYIRANSFHYFRTASPPAPDVASFKISAVSATDADAYRAEFLAYNGRAADARALLDTVLKQDPKNALAYETLGYLAMHDHDMDGAKKWLTEAVQLDSQSYLAHFYYATMSMNEDGLPDAPAIESSLKTAIRLNPAFAPSYDRLACLYLLQHEHLDDAHMLELQAMQLDPSNLYYRINTAHLLAMLQREDDAVRVLDAAKPLAKNPGQSAQIDNALLQIERNRNLRNQAQRMEQLKAIVIETSASASTHPSASADAPKHVVRGMLHNIRCNGDVLELEVDGAIKPVPLYSNNYFKIEFTVIDTAQANVQPCHDLEGKYALVSYVETADKTAAGEIISVEFGGQVNEHVSASTTAPKREARGVLHGVRCGAPSVLELEVDGPAKKLALYATDYYKVNFLATNYQPEGEIHPCTDLEGKHASVVYAVTEDKTAAGQILSIALSR